MCREKRSIQMTWMLPMTQSQKNLDRSGWNSGFGKINLFRLRLQIRVGHPGGFHASFGSGRNSHALAVLAPTLVPNSCVAKILQGCGVVLWSVKAFFLRLKHPVIIQWLRLLDNVPAPAALVRLCVSVHTFCWHVDNSLPWLLQIGLLAKKEWCSRKI